MQPETGLTQRSLRSPNAGQAKWWVGLILILCLGYAGYKGRSYSRLKVGIQEVVSARSDLLQRQFLDRPPLIVLSRIPVVTSIPPASESPAPPPFGQAQGSLQLLLDQFQKAYGRETMQPPERLEFLLSEAVLQNAQGHADQALKTIESASALFSPGPSTTEPSAEWKRVRLLLLQESHWNQKNWPQVISACEAAISAEVDVLTSQARKVVALEQLAKNSEAAEACLKLARLQTDYAGELMLVQKWNAAFSFLTNAVQIFDSLLPVVGKQAVAADGARALVYQANALILMGQAEAARSVLDRLPEQSEIPSVESYLAAGKFAMGSALLISGKVPDAEVEFRASLNHLERMPADPQSIVEKASTLSALGACLVGQRKAAEATLTFSNALNLLVSNPGLAKRKDPQILLAVLHNNQGALARAQGNSALALGELEAADSVARPWALDGASPSAEMTSPESKSPLRLEVLLGFTEKSMDVVTKAHLAGQGGPYVAATTLGMICKNRGLEELSRSNFVSAITYLKESIQTYGRLVEDQNQLDLVPEYAKTLTSTAWILATSPKPEWRQGKLAKDYANKACQVTGYRVSAALQALAAAQAELGQFDEAAKTQQKAIDIAPANQQASFRPALESYQAKQPVRSSFRLPR